MQILLLLGILATFTATSARVFKIHLSAHCPLRIFWCLKQNIFEEDVLWHDIWAIDQVCGNGQDLYSNITHEEGIFADGLFDYDLELEAMVYHNCTTDGKVRMERVRLTDYDGYKSISEHKNIKSFGDPIDINYGFKYILNLGIFAIDFENIKARKRRFDLVE